MVVVGWVLFRAESLGQVQAFLACMVGSVPPSEAVRPAALYFNNEALVAFAAGVLFATPAVRRGFSVSVG